MTVDKSMHINNYAIRKEVGKAFLDTSFLNYIIYTFIMIISFCYVAISDDISKKADFQFMVTMVSEFRYFIFLIQYNIILQGEITISSTRTTRVNGNIIPLFLSS